MRRSLVALAVLLSGLQAHGVTPSEEVVQGIAELRKQVGDQGSVVADEEGFVEALRDYIAPPGRPDEPGATNLVPANPFPNLPAAGSPVPTNQDFSEPSLGEQRPVSHEWNSQPSVPRERWTSPATWVEDRPAPARQGSGANSPQPQQAGWPAFNQATHQAPFQGPPHERNGGPHAAPSRREPRRLLQESAFHLERIAHQLETSDLYREADALRSTADKLRKSARELDPPPPGDRGPRDGADRPRRDKRRDRPHNGDAYPRQGGRDSAPRTEPLPARGVHGGPTDPRSQLKSPPETRETDAYAR